MSGLSEQIGLHESLARAQLRWVLVFIVAVLLPLSVALGAMVWLLALVVAKVFPGAMTPTCMGLWSLLAINFAAMVNNKLESITGKPVAEPKGGE